MCVARHPHHLNILCTSSVKQHYTEINNNEFQQRYSSFVALSYARTRLSYRGISVCLSDRLSVCLSVCPSVRPSVYLSVCLSVRPSVCLSVHWRDPSGNVRLSHLLISFLSCASIKVKVPALFVTNQE